MSDAPQLPPILYGIWIPGSGWWKTLNDKTSKHVAYSDMRRKIVARYARWIGHGARVEPVDSSLVANEKQLIDFEREKGAWKERVKDLFGAAVLWSKSKWPIWMNSKSNH